jgi:uncharacterized delta-60 repeat protein
MRPRRNRATARRRPRTWMRIALACGLALMVVAVAGATAATTHPGLDPTYGKGGVVRVTAPEVPQTASPEGFPSADLYVTSFGVAGDGSAYVLGSSAECGPEYCSTAKEFLERYEADGDRDEAFGIGNKVTLTGELTHHSVTADSSDKALVAGLNEKTLEISRFTTDGRPDVGFGEGGVVRLHCACLGSQIRLLPQAGERVLVDVNTPIRFYELGTHVRLIELGPNGAIEQTFAAKGTARIKISEVGEPRAVVEDADGATLIGGSGHRGCCGVDQVYLRRISADGRPDKRFDRDAARSLKRLGQLGKHPGLVAMVPLPNGSISVFGTSKGGREGFNLRLRHDGTLGTGFGSRGLLHLPFTVESAVGGAGGSVFAVGSSTVHGYGSTRVFRVLADGGLDPRWRGSHGRGLPLSGIRIHLTSLGDGRVMVTDNGNSFCRSACVARPAIARFRE